MRHECERKWTLFFDAFDVPELPPDPASGGGRTEVEKDTPGMLRRVAQRRGGGEWVGDGGGRTFPILYTTPDQPPHGGVTGSSSGSSAQTSLAWWQLIVN